MQLHAGLAASAETSGCRTLVGGFGSPGQRDLDFGEKFIRCAEALEWPEGVVLEDLSYAAHLVLHRLQELRPAKVVLVGAVSRGDRAPGSIRRYRLDPAPPAPEDVHGHLADAIAGEVGLDHTLAVVGHWGGLPPETVVVEVEAADASFGVGFSEELASAMDPLLEIVRDELGHEGPCDLQDSALPSAFAAAPCTYSTARRGDAAQAAVATAGAHPGIGQLFEYAEAHRQLRGLEGFGRSLPTTAGLSIAARFLPAGRALRTTGNWYDIISLGAGLGLVMGDVPAHGMQAISEVGQLRAAVRAFALVEGHSPARLMTLVDRLVESTDMGEGTALVYLAVDSSSGSATFSCAGHCLPLLVSHGRSVEFVEPGPSTPLGMAGAGPRRQTTIRLTHGSTLLLFSSGLIVNSGADGEGLKQLRGAVANGPRQVEQLCDYVLDVCLGGPRGDDVSLLAVRLDA